MSIPGYVSLDLDTPKSCGVQSSSMAPRTEKSTLTHVHAGFPSTTAQYLVSVCKDEMRLMNILLFHRLAVPRRLWRRRLRREQREQDLVRREPREEAAQQGAAYPRGAVGHQHAQLRRHAPDGDAPLLRPPRPNPHGSQHLARLGAQRRGVAKVQVQRARPTQQRTDATRRRRSAWCRGWRASARGSRDTEAAAPAAVPPGGSGRGKPGEPSATHPRPGREGSRASAGAASAARAARAASDSSSHTSTGSSPVAPRSAAYSRQSTPLKTSRRRPARQRTEAVAW